MLFYSLLLFHQTAMHGMAVLNPSMLIGNTFQPVSTKLNINFTSSLQYSFYDKSIVHVVFFPIKSPNQYSFYPMIALLRTGLFYSAIRNTVFTKDI